MLLILGMSDVWVIIICVVIGGCLLVLYLKVFLLIILNMFGGKRVKML